MIDHTSIQQQCEIKGKVLDMTAYPYCVVGEAFNFGTAAPISVNDLVKETIRISGKQSEPRILNEVKNEILKQYLSSEKANRVLGWKAEVSLKEGLKEAYQWYEDYFKKNR